MIMCWTEKKIWWIRKNKQLDFENIPSFFWTFSWFCFQMSHIFFNISGRFRISHIQLEYDIQMLLVCDFFGVKFFFCASPEKILYTCEIWGYCRSFVRPASCKPLFWVNLLFFNWMGEMCRRSIIRKCISFCMSVYLISANCKFF